MLQNQFLKLVLNFVYVRPLTQIEFWDEIYLRAISSQSCLTSSYKRRFRKYSEKSYLFSFDLFVSECFLIFFGKRAMYAANIFSPNF